MTLATFAIVVSGFKFMRGYEEPAELTGLQAFGYFTVQSNVFMAMVSFVFAIKEIKILKGKIETIPFKYYIFKMIATTAIGLTFCTVLIIFSILFKKDLLLLLKNM